MARKKTKQKATAVDIIAEIAKIDRDLAEYINRELLNRRTNEYAVIPAYMPTRIGEQPVPTVSTRIIAT